MHCEECNCLTATLVCSECDELFCKDCSESIHRGGKRKLHVRQLICKHCKSVAQKRCWTCEVPLCENCTKNHPDHALEPTSFVSKVSVFWDLHSCRVSKKEDVETVLKNIRTLYDNIAEIKAFGDSYQKWSSVFNEFGIELIVSNELKDLQTFILELSLSAGKYLTHILILSGYAAYMKPHLTQIQNNFPNVTLLFSQSISPLEIKNIQLLPIPFGFYRIVNYQDPQISNPDQPKLCKTGDLMESCSDRQQFTVKRGQNQYHDLVAKRLKSFVKHGQMTIDLEWFINDFSIKYGLSYEKSSEVLNQTCNLGILFLSRKQFGGLNPKDFIGLKLESLSLESLQWVLKSLKIDEMLPIERTIQSRIKEAFDFKPTNSQWRNLLEKCKNSQNYLISEIDDPQNESTTFLVFPREDQWFSYDQYIRTGDPLNMKNTHEWNTLIAFCESYYKTESEASTAIPGGRYGCAQLIKFFGPKLLQECSLGKLSYMVQLAIDEDVIRYQKALLVLSSTVENKIEDLKIDSKLEDIRKNIIEILKDEKAGLPLAQIPLHLKKRFSMHLDITKFGFSKLKDFLRTIKNVKVEKGATNQPFAFLSNEVTIEEIVSEILKFSDYTHLEEHLVSKFGCIDWNNYSSKSLDDFLFLNHLQPKQLEFNFTLENPLDLEKPFLAHNLPPIFLKSNQELKNSINEIETTSEEPENHHQLKFIYDLLSDEDLTENPKKKTSKLDPDATPFFSKNANLRA
ncbi:unnamed protein product [Blepharisma stoltei]|uniref:B box-type domain-containing protein n=1 Tax=Blepharisma stoltei TaxID=1481888 RepID=A0AAU9KJD5_9CILI|nr:unnamed protein product [Blepharisma stoltei]